MIKSCTHQICLKNEHLNGGTLCYKLKEEIGLMLLLWEEFKNLVERKFCPKYEKEQMANKFLSHRMLGVDCRGYTSTFFKYARIVPSLASPEPVLIFVTSGG
uniref:Retrotransposon gag domain-containing protein n=1 Tax=Helianthus annuus TaxID=4232 RepID=A0A251U5J5_HELAN